MFFPKSKSFSLLFLGLILVPNGKLIGQHFGDRYPSEEAWAKLKLEKATSAGKNVSLSNAKIRGGDDTEGPGIQTKF